MISAGAVGIIAGAGKGGAASFVVPDFGFAAKDYTGTALDTNIATGTDFTPTIASTTAEWESVFTLGFGTVQRTSAITNNPIKVVSTAIFPTASSALVNPIASTGGTNNTYVLRFQVASNSGGDQFVANYLGGTLSFQVRWNAGTGTVTVYSGTASLGTAYTTSVGTITGVSANTWYTLVLKATGSSTSFYIIGVGTAVTGSAAGTSISMSVGKILGTPTATTTNVACGGILLYNSTTITDAQINASVTNYLGV